LNINDYIFSIESIVYSISIATNYHFHIDRKTEDIAFISGRIDFKDGSMLEFKEFIEKTDSHIEKYKYGYNYRMNTDILFRYDNAPDPRAKKLTSFPHHKHLRNGNIIASKPVEFIDIIREIEEIMFNQWKEIE